MSILAIAQTLEDVGIDGEGNGPNGTIAQRELATGRVHAAEAIGIIQAATILGWCTHAPATDVSVITEIHCLIITVAATDRTQLHILFTDQQGIGSTVRHIAQSLVAAYKRQACGRFQIWPCVFAQVADGHAIWSIATVERAITAVDGIVAFGRLANWQAIPQGPFVFGVGEQTGSASRGAVEDRQWLLQQLCRVGFDGTRSTAGQLEHGGLFELWQDM